MVRVKVRIERMIRVLNLACVISSLIYSFTVFIGRNIYISSVLFYLYSLMSYEATVRGQK